MTQPTFNLIDEPWIGAVDENGTLKEYGLRELLAQAHHLRSLHDDSPLVIAAVLRMILALLHRIYDGPRNSREWEVIWAANDGFDMARIERYFVQWHSRFDLFDQEHPFYQCTEPIEKERTASLAILVHEVASGSNATLFDHATDEIELCLSPASAARMLLTVPLYGFSGRVSGPAYFSDGPCVRDILFLAEGSSLFKTLVLNLLEYNDNYPIQATQKDAPAWEMNDPHKPDRNIPYGYLDFLTWQDRKIRLVAMVSGGEIRVNQMSLAPGLQLDSSVLERDPMKHYRIDEKDAYIALRFREDKAVWRDSASLLQIAAKNRQVPAVFRWLARLSDQGILNDDVALRFMALGMATEPGKAVVEFYRSEHLPLPPAYLKEPQLVDLLTKALEAAENTASELWKASSTMAAVLLAPDEEGARRANPDDVRDLRATMGAERRYWAGLEPFFRETMQALPDQSIEAMRRWFDWLREAAWSTFDEVSDGLGDGPRALKAAVRGREQLAQGLGKVLKFEA
jgi:CRISPR system Cascade subunit CasA